MGRNAVLQMIEANSLAFALALVIGLLVAWWIFRQTTKTPRARSHRPDVLDEGAAPAQRNQALIDQDPAVMASAAASIAATGPDIMMGMGEIAASAAADEARAVQHQSRAAAEAPAAPPPPVSPPAASASEADDLRKIKGVGPKLVALLHGLGVTRYSQIAAWTEDDVAKVDAQLGNFAGRITRDNWIEQAKLLAAGDTSGFEGKFGKL
jgi:predicted flap endonuclease-1-like 5' DNA nuclease